MFNSASKFYRIILYIHQILSSILDLQNVNYFTLKYIKDLLFYKTAQSRKKLNKFSTEL